MKPFGRTDFDQAFQPEAVFHCPQRGRICAEPVEIAEIVLPSGRLIACDPCNLRWKTDRIPFARTAPPGKYPVLLCLTNAEDSAHSGVAGAMIRFKPERPAAWEMAVLPGQNPATLPVGQFFGYGVDTGMGCFIDAEAAARLTEDNVDRMLRELEEILKPLMASGLKPKDGADVPLDKASGANIIAFSSGYGDGAYPSYWGLDAKGQPCCLATDFGILVEHLEGQTTFPLRDWIGKTLSHPDLMRIGLTIRVLQTGGPESLGLRLELEGTSDSCKAIVVNAGKEYSSDRLPYQVIAGIGSYDFRFNEPLRADAELILEYGMGVRAL